MLTRLFAACAALLTMTYAAAATTEVIVDFSNAKLTIKRNGVIVASTPVVLPRGDYYQVPTGGPIRRAVMGPTWTPTANMHRQMPGRYKKWYGPFEPGNAMGHCKLYIDFRTTGDYPIMNTVRIHGNAEAADLGKRLSRSCIRVPDDFCEILVGHTAGGGQVEFVR